MEDLGFLKEKQAQISKKPVKFADNLSPFCPNCGSGEYMTNGDGNSNNFCGQCGTGLDWDNMQNIDEEGEIWNIY